MFSYKYKKRTQNGSFNKLYYVNYSTTNEAVNPVSSVTAAPVSLWICIDAVYNPVVAAVIIDPVILPAVPPVNDPNTIESVAIDVFLSSIW